MNHRIVTVAERQDLVPTIAEWIWNEWARNNGRTLEQVIERISSRKANLGAEQTFILLENEVPVATASLTHKDRDERPDATPWLPSVYVAKAFRGQSYASILVQHVESACIEANIDTVWLGTETAAPLYERLGWKPDGAQINGCQIMRRKLGPIAQCNL